MPLFEKKGCVPVRRFPIAQDGKVRYCDDLRRSGTNDCAPQEVKIDLPGVDTLAQIATELQSSTGENPAFWKRDHASAYKQLPLSVDHSDLCVVVAQGPNGVWYCFKPNTVLFGSSLAVLSCNVCSRFLSCLFTLWYLVPCISFFDDFSWAALAGVEEECVRAFEAFNEILGFKVKPEKNAFGREIPFLGLRVRSGSPVSIELPSDKREKYRAQILGILRSGKCSSADADSVYGRLQWAESCIFGRAVKVFLAPIAGRKYSHKTHLSARLKVALEFLASYLIEPRVRLFARPSRQVDFVVFSDASLTGLGVCVIPARGPQRLFSCTVPDSFVSSLPAGASAIFILELLAALLGVQLLASDNVCAGKQAYVFIDNNASLASLCKGVSKCPEAQKVILSFWSTVDQCGVSPWIERVASSLNLADRPSRDMRVGVPVAFPTF